MKVFEFYLNPKIKAHRDLQVFCFEPSNRKEKYLGNLCLAGELENILPPNKNLLKNLGELLKNIYYKTDHPDPENALQATLKEANKFLANLVKQGNVSWMGNLHLAVLAVYQNNIYFSKTGNIKLILLRDKEMIDIESNFSSQDYKPKPTPDSKYRYLTQSFFNIILGKVELGDKILIITSDVMQIVDTLNLIPAIALTKNGKEEKEINKILKKHQKDLKNYSGLLLLITIDKIIKLPQENDYFNLILEKIKAILPKKKIKEKRDKPRLTLKPQVKISLLKSLEIKTRFDFLNSPLFKKRLILIMLLALIIGIGFSLAQWQKKKEIDIAEKQLAEVRNLMWKAEQNLILNQDQKANELLKEAFLKLKELQNSPLQEKTEKLIQQVEQKLVKINKLENISNPEILFSMKELNFEPQQIKIQNHLLYVINDSRNKIYNWDLSQNKGKLIELKEDFDLSTISNNELVFYKKTGDENKLFTLNQKETIIFPPAQNFLPSLMSSFADSIYFMDKNTRQIIKYNLFWNQTNLAPISWLKSPDDRLKNAKSMAIDGSIWILTFSEKEGYQIERYYANRWQETIKLEIWPELKSAVKIYTAPDLSYLYLLDPKDKRVIVLSKTGKIVKQYQSQKFNSLKDFAVSKNEKNIYVLSDKDIYLLSLK